MPNGYKPHPHQQPNIMSRAHPVLVLGIFIFIVPFFKNLVNIGIPGFVYTAITVIGIIFMAVGGVLSIFSTER